MNHRSPELVRLLSAGVRPDVARVLAEAVDTGGVVVEGAYARARGRRRSLAATLARVRPGTASLTRRL